MSSKFLLALSFLTVIPVKQIKNYTDSMWSEGVIFYPVCGYIIAAFTILPVMFLAYIFNTESLLLGGIAVAILVIITGGLHLDGFADLCDGFLCPVDSIDRRIEIMHDSRVGSFGVVGLIILLLIKFSSLTVLFNNREFYETASVIVFARFIIVLLAASSKYPQDKGIGKFVIGKINPKNLILSAILIIPCLFSIKIIFAFVLVILFTFFLKDISYKLIGGVTGDVLGANCELCETIGFFILALSC